MHKQFFFLGGGGGREGSILSEFQNPLFHILIGQKLFPVGGSILYMYLHSSFSLSLQTFFVSLIVAISAVLCFKAMSLFAFFP